MGGSNTELTGLSDRFEKYIIRHLKSISTGNDEALLYDYDDKRFQKVSSFKIELLSQCDTLRSLKEHYTAISSDSSVPSFPSDLHHILNELSRNELLLSQRAILEAIKTRPYSQSTPISRLCWPTGNRPDVLRQSILSFHTNLRHYGRSLPVTITDNSSDYHSQKATKHMLSSLADEEDLNISYAGTEEKHRFIRRLGDEISRDGIDPENLKFALQPDVPANSANRNAVLLASAGEIIASHDDDFLCRCGRTAERIDALEIRSETEDLKIRLCTDTADIDRQLFPADIDLIGEYENFVGRGFSEVVNEWALKKDSIIWDEVSPLLVNNLIHGRGRVLTAAPGNYGDAGSTRYHMLLNTRSYAVTFETKSIRRYVDTLCSGVQIRYRPNYTLFGGGVFTNNAALDNRDLVPPYFPIFRNQDGLMGMVLHACYPEDMFLRIPYSLFHRRDRRYSFDRAELRKYYLLVSDYISMLLMRFRPSSTTDPQTRMISLGRYLDEIGRMQAKELAHYVRAIMTAEVGRYCYRLEEKLAEFNYSPKFWVEDVEAHLKEVRRSIAGEGFFVPLELQDMQDPEAAQRRLQELISGFGKLLTVWPGIREAALRLSAQGVHIAEQL